MDRRTALLVRFRNSIFTCSRTTVHFRQFSSAGTNYRPVVQIALCTYQPAGFFPICAFLRVFCPLLIPILHCVQFHYTWFCMHTSNDLCLKLFATTTIKLVTHQQLKGTVNKENKDTNEESQGKVGKIAPDHSHQLHNLHPSLRAAISHMHRKSIPHPLLPGYCPHRFQSTCSINAVTCQAKPDVRFKLPLGDPLW